MSDDLPGLLPHGELTQPLPGLWFVTGKMLLAMSDPPLPISRNMTVIQDGDDLTLVNTMRLDDAGLAALDAMGRVRHIVKLGSFHGRDDAFYVRRYPDATMWAPPGMPHDRGVTTDRELAGDTPVPGASTFLYETPTNVEAVLHVQREGGVLLSCDSLQNWETPDDHFDEASKKGMASFFGRARVGFGWLKHNKPQRPDFDRLLELDFDHLLPAHGTPLLGGAHDAVRRTVDATFPT